MTVAKARKPRTKQPGTTPRGSVSIAKLAEGVGVSETTINKYLKRGCPRTSVQAVMRWRAENIKAVAEDADPSELSIELRRALLADKTESARAKQLKNDIVDGRLVFREDVIRDISIVLARFKNRVLSLGTEVAMICPDDIKVTVKKAVDTTVETALREIVAGLDEWA